MNKYSRKNATTPKEVFCALLIMVILVAVKVSYVLAVYMVIQLGIEAFAGNPGLVYFGLKAILWANGFGLAIIMILFNGDRNVIADVVHKIFIGGRG